MRRILLILANADWILIIIPILLSSLGLVIIYSLSLAQNRPELFWSQVVYNSIAVIVFIGASIIDYRSLKAWTPYIYLISLILLISVFIFGHAAFGAKRWIDLGPFQLQPSEIIKPALILLLAKILSEKERINWKQFFLCLIFTGLPASMILIQPDLGSAGTVISLMIILLIASRLSWKNLGVLIMISFIALTAGWFSLKDYQKTRIEVFLNRSNDIQQQNYNVRQSIIAVGSGGLTGQGIGHGSQSQLNFLPVAHTDFIFASVAESTGFVGSLLVLTLYGILIWRILIIVGQINDLFAMYICIGVAGIILVQVTVNIGMNIGLLPVTGIPLPFISHGGSSLIAIAINIGIVEGIYLRRKKIKFTTP